MKNAGWIILIGLGVWLYTKIRAGLGLSFNPRGVSFQGASLLINLGVVNPTMFPLQFNSFNGYLTVNGTPVGIIQDSTPVSLQPNGAETIVPVLFAPNVGVLITDIISYFKTGGAAVVGITGTANVENLNVPINQSLSVAAL